MLVKSDLKKINQKIKTEMFLYDMHSSDSQKIKERIGQITEILGKPSLRGPIVAITQELMGNALKAVYKKIYFEHVIPHINIGELSYEVKLHLFRVEINTNQTKNFFRVAKETDVYVTVTFEAKKEGLELLVKNPGEPTKTETHRMESALENAQRLSNLSYIFDDDDEDEKESQKEGAGLGLSLVVMTLRSLSLPLENIQICSQNGHTFARVLFPWGVFLDDTTEKVSKIKGVQLNKEISQIINGLGYHILTFNAKGNLLKVSESFLRDYNLSDQRSELKKVIPSKFFKDVFLGLKNITIERKIDNYYIKTNLKSKSDLKGTPEVSDQSPGTLFHISAFFNKDSTITSIWRPISKEQEPSFRSFLENKVLDTIKLQEVIRPYLPEKVLLRAEQSVKENSKEIPQELRSVTIFFADMVGFTKKVELINPESAVNLLNIALSILVRSVENQQGYVDKFMGDSVMAIFDSPLNAIIAAAEVQHLFGELNEYRKYTEEEPIKVRIGIHSGEVMMGNIGTHKRKDWTAIGDVVNTAARLEKNSKEGAVLISSDTYKLTHESVLFDKKGILKAKGKDKEVDVYFVKSVRFLKYGREIHIDIRN